MAAAEWDVFAACFLRHQPTVHNSNIQVEISREKASLIVPRVEAMAAG
jgi:hypothetical protein